VAANPVNAAANKYGIPPAIFRALVQQESGGHQSAHSPAGAIGETQLMPGTARALGVNPYDAQQNLKGGAKYLRQQLDRFGGDVPRRSRRTTRDRAPSRSTGASRRSRRPRTT
jgi:soluble lytic murein transglycosylase-like protein